MYGEVNEAFRKIHWYLDRMTDSEKEELISKIRKHKTVENSATGISSIDQFIMLEELREQDDKFHKR